MRKQQTTTIGQFEQGTV